LADLARKHRVSILIIHHTRKAPAADPFDCISGSTGLTAAADGLLILTKQRGKTDCTLYLTGRDLEEREIALRWDQEISGWVIIGDAKEHRRSKERNDIINILKKIGEPLGPKEVASALGKNHSTTRWLMVDMAHRNEIKSVGKGKYIAEANSTNSINSGESNCSHNTLAVGGQGDVGYTFGLHLTAKQHKNNDLFTPVDAVGRSASNAGEWDEGEL
jgi:hypothetical protein